jgi:hypothetical protein
MEEDVTETPVVAFGEIVAERNFTLYEKSGLGRQVVVKIGKPVPAPHLAVYRAGEHFCCPLSITGLGMDSRTFSLFGVDSLSALHAAVALAGQVIDGAVGRLNLVNPLLEVRERRSPGGKHFDASGLCDWIYRYDSRPDTDYGLWKRR